MQLWNTFDTVREALTDQYFPLEVNPASGLPPDELKAAAIRYQEERRDLPRILLKAELFGFLLEHVRIGIDPADWFADHFETPRLLVAFREEWRREAEQTIAASTLERNREADRDGLGHAQLDLSHTSPDWRSILELGICGLRDRAARALPEAPDREARDFLSAAVTVFEAMRKFVLRLAKEAEAQKAVRVIDSLHTLAEQPPQTFQQALQLVYLYNQLQEFEGELVRAMGSFDRLFLPFYRADLAAGRLNREQAKELLKFFWTKFYAQRQSIGKNFCFGGGDTANELSELGYETYRELAVHDPKLSLRVSRHTPDWLLLQAAECLKHGLTGTVFANDDVAEEMFRKRGKQPGDIDDFILIGCYEPAIMGRELSCSMEIVFNLAKPAELVCRRKTEYRSFPEFEAAYFNCLQEHLGTLLEFGRQFERTWPQTNPSPLLSGTMPGCIRRGRDVSAAGADYNTGGVMCAGIGSAADSLAAVKTLVFDRKLCTMKELREALEADWQGYDRLRFEALHRTPKWGNNDPEADRLARKLTDFAARLINHTPNARGGTFQMGLWSIDLNFPMGARTGALPDGRRAGEPLSKNTCSAVGMDRNGVTALIQSLGKLDHTEFPDGSVLDVMLHPSAVSGSDGAQLLVDLIRTCFKLGGLAIQFNIFNAETLRDAQREPEKYANLQVRVCGWNARFIDLSREAQDAFIAQAEALR